MFHFVLLFYEIGRHKNYHWMDSDIFGHKYETNVDTKKLPETDHSQYSIQAVYVFK